MKRFKIWKASTREPLFHADTIAECVEFAQKENEKDSPDDMWIECREDDIEIPVSELLEAWEDDERPKDLQMF